MEKEPMSDEDVIKISTKIVKLLMPLQLEYGIEFIVPLLSAFANYCISYQMIYPRIDSKKYVINYLNKVYDEEENDT